MSESIIEVKDGVLRTHEGEEVHVEGGAYLPPQAWLLNDGELQQLRARMRELEERSLVVPALVGGAVLLGAALGYRLARRSGA